MSGQPSPLEVWLDCDLCPPSQVGLLFHDRGQIRFRYHPAWLRQPQAFAIDPDLSLDEHVFFPRPELGNFGIFLDSSPDRWGQTLMKRREALEATDQNRPARTLYAWDYLLGVQDATRQGALRFKRQGGAEYLANDQRPAPLGNTSPTKWLAKPGWMCPMHNSLNSAGPTERFAFNGLTGKANSGAFTPRP